MQKTKEAEAQQAPFYEYVYSTCNERREQAMNDQVVFKGKDLPWEQGRQARLKWYLHPLRKDSAIAGRLFFLQEIRIHSGRHRHQGGLALYVVEGVGWTTMDGIRHDWEEGDLILLPNKPHGVEHQHFNASLGSPCKWLAIIHEPIVASKSSELEQKEVSPDWAHV